MLSPNSSSNGLHSSTLMLPLLNVSGTAAFIFRLCVHQLASENSFISTNYVLACLKCWLEKVMNDQFTNGAQKTNKTQRLHLCTALLPQNKIRSDHESNVRLCPSTPLSRRFIYGGILT